MPGYSQILQKREKITEFVKNKNTPTLSHFRVFFQRLFFQKKYNPTNKINQKNGDSRKRSALDRIKNTTIRNIGKNETKILPLFGTKSSILIKSELDDESAGRMVRN
jgi:hypothetical protein